MTPSIVGVPEWIAGVLFGGIVILLAGAYLVRGLLPTESDKTQSAVSAIAGALVTALAGASLLTTIWPRTPLVIARLEAPGERFTLPPAAHGALRFSMRAHLSGTGAAEAEIELAAGSERIRARVSRRLGQMRVGRRGRRTVVRDETLAFVSTNIPAGVDEVALAAVRGPVKGSIEVGVFEDIVPLESQLVAAVVLLGLITWAAHRSGRERAPMIAAGLALGFGIGVHEIANPELAVNREIGALLSGGLGGAAVGALMAAVFRRASRKEIEGERKAVTS